MKTILRLACAIPVACSSLWPVSARAQDARPDPFVALQLTPEYMIAHLRYEWGATLLWDRLVPVDHYSAQTIPANRPDAWTDENIKALLTSVDATLTRWAAPVSKSSVEQVAIIQQAYARVPAGFHNPKDGLAYDRSFIQWAKDHCDFIRDAGDVVAFTPLLQHLRPGSIESPHLPGGYDASLAHGSRRLPFYEEMAAISAVIDLPRAQEWLPARFDLKRLRARERELKQQDERHAFDYQGRVSNGEAVMVSQRVREAWTQGPMAASGAQVSKEIELLNVRMARLADPVKSGFCERMKIDLPSLAASSGVPAQVRMADGRPSDIHSYDYYSIFEAYSRGCGGKQDLRAAKRTLQLWAETPHDNFKMVLASHCTLARWERFGVGGRRNETAAKEWESRALRDAGQACRADGPEDLIDPRDPMSDLHL